MVRLIIYWGQFFHEPDLVQWVRDSGAQLASLLSNLLTKKPGVEALGRKGDLYLKPAICAETVTYIVNAEIWDKLSKTARSKDLKSRR